MTQLPAMITDLAFILSIAGGVCLIFKKLRQPIVLGYLVAGVLVGPHVPFLPNIADHESVTHWAEIGVIFLLFQLGLEFSFKKLAQVGKRASITAVFEVAFMLGAGFITGSVLGWNTMDSVFLGGILAISSTTIIVKAFEELGMKGRRFVSLVFGVLIVEDLVAIVLLLMLSTIGVTKTFAGEELLYSCLRFSFFLVLWFVLGIYLVPSLLKKVRDLLSDETMLIVSVGLCFSMVVLATRVGFSPALGAFVMGSILAETLEGKRIEHLITPLKDLFGAIFFVSVGILIDLKTIEDPLFGSYLTLGRHDRRQSHQHHVGSIVVRHEPAPFNSIRPKPGSNRRILIYYCHSRFNPACHQRFLYPIAVAVSAITTFTTPYLIRSADPLSRWAERKDPPYYHRETRTLPGSSSRSRREKLITTPLDGVRAANVLQYNFGIRNHLRHSEHDSPSCA